MILPIFLIAAAVVWLIVPWGNSRRKLKFIAACFMIVIGVIFLIKLLLQEPLSAGAMYAQQDPPQIIEATENSGLNSIRIPVYFDDNYKNNNADQYLAAGYHVQLNFNYKATGVTVPFPIDSAFIRSQAERFFQYYRPYLDQIPVVVCENEWDNRDYHSGPISDYIKELKIVVDIAHKYGFKITDGGITGNNLGRWTYTQLSGDSAAWWKDNYFIGENNESWDQMLQDVADFTRMIKGVPLDYINTHWYNKDNCPGGYPIAIEKYKQATGKGFIPLCNNEFGIKINSEELWIKTLDEIEAAGAEIMIAYSGVNQPGKAITLTDRMLKELANRQK